MHGPMPSTPSTHEIPHIAAERRGVGTSPKRVPDLPLATLRPSVDDQAQAQRMYARRDTPGAVQHTADAYASVRAEMLAEALDDDDVDLVARLVRDMAAGACAARARLAELAAAAEPAEEVSV